MFPPLERQICILCLQVLFVSRVNNTGFKRSYNPVLFPFSLSMVCYSCFSDRVSQCCLKLIILLPQPSKCWPPRGVPAHLTLFLNGLSYHGNKSSLPCILVMWTSRYSFISTSGSVGNQDTLKQCPGAGHAKLTK